jgi:hypothetical protein
MLKIILVVLLVGITAFLAYVALKPADFRIARTQRINAAPRTIFALINDLRNFNTWNPFAAGDPALKITYTGPDSGKGAAYAWDSSGKSGKGTIAITESVAPSRVLMTLTFERPYTATNVADFTIASDESGSTVTWTMSGHNGYLQKLFGTLFDLDKIIGGQFEQGLAKLKVIAER